MSIEYDYIPIRIGNDGCRSGYKIDEIVFNVDHDTGTPSATARNVVNYYKTIANEKDVSFHWIADDKDIIVMIPCFSNAEKAWHVLYGATLDNEVYGCNANDCAISGELCYFPNDLERSAKAYNNYVKMAAFVCLYHNISPYKRLGHFELQPWNRTDPNNALGYLGLTYEDMKLDIVERYNDMTNKTADEVMALCFDEPEEWILQLDRLEEFGETFESELLCKYIRTAFEKVYKQGLEDGSNL